VQLADAGRFDVVVSNAAGAVTSAPPAALAVSAGAVARHSALVYIAPGTNLIACELTLTPGRFLYSVLWRPELPPGWRLLWAKGDGLPIVIGNEILFLGLLTENPLKFVYAVSVPAGATGPQLIRGTADVLLNGMSDPVALAAAPNPLPVEQAQRHMADYRAPYWSLDATEINRVLAFWRARSYSIAQSLDGFAPGAGETNGMPHTADFRPAYWYLDGTELNRPLAYWRAGAYHPNPEGVDGYAPGTGPPLGLAAPPTPGEPPIVGQKSAALFTPGSTLLVTNSFQYGGSLWSLLWRPRLPANWILEWATGDGHPEMVDGEILWTGEIPPGRIEMIYAVRTAAGDASSRTWHGEVEYQMAGSANPVTVYAQPNPINASTLRLDPPSLDRSTLQITIQGQMGQTWRIQASTNLQDWTAVAMLTATNETIRFQFPIEDGSRFFRGVLSER
jgi:hypothetical protein